METEPTELDFSLALHVSRSLKKSLKLKHTQQITQTHSNSNTMSLLTVSYSHSSNLVPLLNLITLQTFTLQTLTLLQTSRHATAQLHHSSNSHSQSSNLMPLLNLNLKVGAPSQSACFD